MNKIINILLFGSIGVALGLFLAFMWLIGIIFILINEVVGTKQFKAKFNKLNKIVNDEFQDIFKCFKDLA